MKKLCTIAALAVGLFAPAMLDAQQMQQLPLDTAVVYGRLDNGLTYYIRHNELPRERVNFYIAQKVGSVQEEEDQRGLAHFLEHMCFNGSEHYPSGEIVKYCESIGVKFGANLNAYTSTDETVYNIDDVPVSGSNIDSCLLILRDWSDGLSLLPEEIDKERGVIHEEWRMRTSAQMRILNRNLESLYPGSRYGKRMPIGLMSVVDNFEPQVLRDYYEKWYRPDLQGVVIVGDIDVKDMEARVKSMFSDIKMPENPAPFEYYDVPNNAEPIYVVDKDKEMTNIIMQLMFKTDPLPIEQNNTMMRYANDFAWSVIANVLNARLSELAQKPDCPFIDAQCCLDEYLLSKTKSCFATAVVPKEGHDKEALSVLVKEVERARRFGLTETEVSRAHETIVNGKESQYNNRDKQYNSFYTGKCVRNFIDNVAFPGIDTEYEIIKMLAQQYNAEVYSLLLANVTASIDSNFVFLAEYPEKDGLVVPTADELKEVIVNAHNAELEAYVDNVKEEPLIPNLPKKGKITKEQPADFGYTMWTLSNGARVFYKQTDFNNSQVVMSATSWGGDCTLSNDYIPAIQLFNTVISYTGLGNFTRVELQKKLAGKRASVGSSLGTYDESLSGNSTPKDLRTLFELTYLKFQEPANDTNGFNSCMAMARTSLENVEKNPMNALNDSINATYYDHNPRFMQIKVGDVDKVKYEDIRRIYKERFKSAGDFDFFFTGAFDVDSLRLFTEQYIASLPGVKKRESLATEQLETYHQGSITNKFERKMETPQAYLWQHWHGERQYTEKEHNVVNCMGSILSMRYLKKIREEAGFAYSVSASAGMGRGVKEGFGLEIQCPFTPAKCDSVVLLVRECIDDIAKNGVTDNELNDYKQFQLKDYADAQRQNGYWSGLIVDKIKWNMDQHTDFENRINSITSDDIKAFINDGLLKANNCITVIILPEDLAEKE